MSERRMRVVAAFRDAEAARLAARDLAALRIDGLAVRIRGPEAAWGGAERTAAQLPDELRFTGGDFSWAGIERQWLNHVLLIAEGVPARALNEVTRTLRQDGAERVTADEG